jgi:hypothetical protein
VQWQNEVTNVGAVPVTTYFDEVRGSSPLLIDVGNLVDDSTFEFIVNAGLAGVSGAFIGNRQANGSQGLKFDQYLDTGLFGMTNFGVVDLYSDDLAPLNVDTHVAFVSDGLTGTDLYVNGVNVHNFSGYPLQMFGMQGLAGVAEAAGGFSDVLDGVIRGFASYDVALTPTEVARHSEAFFIPEPSTTALFTFGSLAFARYARSSRRR